MILIDTNILIAAWDADHQHHAQVRPWFTNLLDSGEAYVIPDIVWLGFSRTQSNPRSTRNPMPMADLLEFARQVRAPWDYLPVSGSHDGWESFERIVAESAIRGDLTTDAYLASLATQLKCPVATLDRDFRRFEGIRVVVPGTA